ncbi:hypothetical protein EX30DRAFT_330537 [Ascodesmis nigricans]|uniref:t-SNARE coiled-coil homology domain-containing protein n=1 Tax=Ascodesmis nigricans TaxID=341454 RepID=A0A4S2MYX3_9PEZI|nr:hypothetical protein EX30DRAFT_330537 [Ascodesmis nigricans]
MGFFSKKDKLKSQSPAPQPQPPQQSSYTPPPPSSNAPYGQPADESRSNALFGDRKSAIEKDHPKQNPYASNPHASAPAPASKPSYGGYGNDARDTKQAQLFSGRPQQQQQAPNAGGGYGANPYERPGANGDYGAPPPYSSGDNNSFRPGRPNPGGYGNSYNEKGGYGTGGRYGNSGDRQLTAEEEEEEDVEAVKQQIRFTKQESVSSTRNALRVAAQAEETGRSTLARLGQQGERLYNTEKNLDLAYSHNRVAEEKARELKTLNGSMFAIHMKNPMKSKARQQAEEQKILDTHQFDRDERERARQFGYESQQHVNQALSGRGYQPSVDRRKGPSLTEREKYQFEADEEDDDMEREIDNNLTQLGHVTTRLHSLALATGQETDRQNKKIGQLAAKSDRVDDGIVLTHNRIKKIH